jgi:isoleucyl-tRNA synthetase
MSVILVLRKKRASKEIGSSLEASLKINLDKKLNEISKDVISQNFV